MSWSKADTTHDNEQTHGVLILCHILVFNISDSSNHVKQHTPPSAEWWTKVNVNLMLMLALKRVCDLHTEVWYMNSLVLVSGVFYSVSSDFSPYFLFLLLHQLTFLIDNAQKKLDSKVLRMNN